MTSSRYQFEVWIRAGGNVAAARQALARAVGLMDSIWGPETKLMGNPLPDMPHSGRGTADTGNGSPRIDVYLVQLNQVIHRSGTPHSIDSEDTFAQAVATGTSAANHPSRAASGLLMLRIDRIGSKGFKSDVIHELFHVLQYAHNAYARATCPGGKFWFSEASATWAESYFDPADAAREVYPRFHAFERTDAEGVKADTWGLGDTRNLHNYESFIWPYFMQQTLGPDAIASAWRDAEGKQTCAGLMDAVNAAFPFSRYFSAFALRNLNDSEQFASGSLSPLTPWYDELHRDFPNGGGDTPLIENQSAGAAPPTLRAQPSSAPPVAESLNVPPRRAWYYHYQVDSGVGSIRIDPALAPQGDFTIDAVKRTGNGSWAVQHLGSSTSTLCVQPDGISQLYLVISDYAYDSTKPLTGDLKLSPLASPCACPDPSQVSSFSANASFSFSQHGSDSSKHSISINHTASLSGKLVPLNQAHTVFAAATPSGSLAIDDSYTDSNPTPADVTHVSSGSGLAHPESYLSVSFNPAACTYFVDVYPYAPVTQTETNQSPLSDQVGDLVTTPDTPIPQGLQPNGSAQITVYEYPPPPPSSGPSPGRVEFQQASNQGGGYNLIADLAQVIANGNSGAALGTVTVHWSLTPNYAQSSARRPRGRPRGAR